MSDETQVAVEVLRQAMLNEQSTRDFYEEAAKKVANEGARRMFKELAEEEVVHVKIVREQHEALKAGRGWKAVANFQDLKDVDITGLDFRRQEMKARITDSTSDLEALTIAAEMENNSFNFYAEQYNSTPDPLAKMLYGNLVKAERHHFDTVMANWEYLANVRP
jgi:rubrerythrin